MTATQQDRPTKQVSLIDPSPREVVHLSPGTKLEVVFTGSGLVSRWRLEERPGHLVLLNRTRHSFTFLVFAGDDDVAPLVLRRTGRSGADELYAIQVVTTG